MKFETAMEKLQQIAQKMEHGELSLDDSLKLYEEATKLSNECLQQLGNAKGKICKLVEDNKVEIEVE